MVRRLLLSGMLAVAFTAVPAWSAETASGTISLLSTSGSNFNYAINLQNTGTVSLGTFWYGWVPGEDFMASSPTNISGPTGWTDNVTNAGPSDGFAIQWIGGTALAPGNSFTFDFSSVDNLASVTGDSVFFPGTPVGTSFVYGGGPFSDGGDEFVVTAAPASAPEPASLALLGAGAAALLLRRRVRRIV